MPEFQIPARTLQSALTTQTKADELRTARATAMCGTLLLTVRTAKSVVYALPPRTAAPAATTTLTGIFQREELTLTAVLWTRSSRRITLLSGGIFRIRSSIAEFSSGFTWAGSRTEMCGFSESISMTAAFMRSLCSTPCP